MTTTAGPEYPKIDSIFRRDPATKHRTFLEGEWTRPEFGYLANVPWIFTEKIDGTNIRVHWDGERVVYGGRKDNTQIHASLVAWLNDRFQGNQALRDMPAGTTLYGEGYGEGIAVNGEYYLKEQKGVGFALFDVRIGDWWLQNPDIADVADRLRIARVPVIGIGALDKAIEMVSRGMDSWRSYRFHKAEGLVVRPRVDLFNRKGDRVIAKMKTRDFARDVANANDTVTAKTEE